MHPIFAGIQHLVVYYTLVYYRAVIYSLVYYYYAYTLFHIYLLHDNADSTSITVALDSSNL